jgi:two-component sensor histidine kinase
MGQMAKWTDEFQRSWRGISQPSLLFSAGFAACCIAMATAVRWGLALIRPDVFFTPYFPAVLFATAFGGFRVGTATALTGALLGVTVNFSNAPVDFARFALMAIYLIVCGLTIWGIEHFRSMASHHRDISKRLTEEETYRKLVVDELQHRLKNKLSTIHAVLRQVLHNQPQVWASIDARLRALSATDDLIARADGSGCDLRELLLSELGPYGHVRFTLNGEPLFLPAKLAVSLALTFHELATNAGKYGAFSSPRGLLQVSWLVTDDRLAIVWDETEGPPIGTIGEPGFGTKLLNSALRPFDGNTEIAYLRTGVHCTLKCRIPRDVA